MSIEKLLKTAKGVDVHSGYLRLRFTYRGKRCEEKLTGLEVNAANARFAIDKLGTIRFQIAAGSFDYAQHFPNSKDALRFGQNLAAVTDPSRRTFGHYLNLYTSSQEARLAPSSVTTLLSKSKHARSKWEDRDIAGILASEVLAWRDGLLKGGLHPGYVNDLMTCVRGTFGLAKRDKIIADNPSEAVVNTEAEEDESDHADPFSREEMQLMETAKTEREDERAAACFVMWTGLSLSEWMALAWEDVDFNRQTVSVRRGVVQNVYKCPKQKVRTRTVEVPGNAWYWLMEQYKRTYHLPPRTIEVLQRNRTMRQETLRLIWRNSSNLEPFTRDTIFEKVFFARFQRDLGIRKRSPNQLRHTFASHALSNYVPKEWVQNQLGHTSEAMMRRHYARFMPKDARSMISEVDTLMGKTELAKQAAKPGPHLGVV